MTSYLHHFSRLWLSTCPIKNILYKTKALGPRYILVWILWIVWTLVWIVNYLHGSFLVNDFKRHAVFSVVCFCTRRKAMDNLLSTASISNKNQMILEFSALHLTNRREKNCNTIVIDKIVKIMICSCNLIKYVIQNMRNIFTP